MSLNQPTPEVERLLDTSRMQAWIGDGDGQIQVSCPRRIRNCVQQMVPQWAETLGLRSNCAAIGDSTGYYDQGLSINMEAGRRSSDSLGVLSAKCQP